MINEIRYIFEKDWDEKKYWRRRKYIQSHRTGNILSCITLMLLRRTEAKKCCTTGLSLKDRCCYIESPLILYHGLNGIVLAPNVYIGKNVVIYQHVTIAESDPDRQTIIEDNVMIGAGAVILNNVHIGKNAKIGANSVVTKNVPRGATVGGVPAVIISESKI